jgi:hypothetical protein
MGLRRAVRVASFLLPALAACELEEITLVDPRDAVVAEAYLQLGVPPGLDEAPGPARDRLTVFLHRTLGREGESLPVPGARVVVRERGGGPAVELATTVIERCVATTPVDGTGTCYWTPPDAVPFEPGDTVELRVDLPDGGVMESLSVVPADFRILGVPQEPGGACQVPGGTSLELAWTSAAGAWSYVNETIIEGLPEALAPAGIEVDPEDDPLYLLGLSISAADTTIVFPGEFGLFDRFDLDQDLALALQEGLPAPARARVTVAATDRNYVNWVRGGNFNPSGQVRVPSVRGDGTGVFGSAVVRGFRVIAAPPGVSYDLPSCPGALPAGG